MTSVLIADDQTLVRTGFRLVLEGRHGIEVVGEAGDGEEAVRLSAELRPDIILMDIRMPGMDGIEATRRIVAEDAEARVVMLTTFDLDEYVFNALAAGASGFLLKDLTGDQLVASIHVVATGEAMIAPSVTRRLIERHTRITDGAGRADLSELTSRELDVLRALAEGMSNAEIADHLHLAESTVKTHVTRVLSKLRVRDRVQAVIAAYESGLVKA